MLYLLDKIDEQHGKAMLVWLNCICGRLFRFAEHRENMLRGSLTLLARRFGPGFIPDDLHLSVPALVAELAPGKNGSRKSNGNGVTRPPLNGG